MHIYHFMKITLNIPENKIEAFWAYIKDLKYVKDKVINREEKSEDVPEWQKELVLKRIEEHKRNPKKLIPANKALDNVLQQL